ncbi:TPA: hypothetical protein HA351_04160 [Methanosarcinaceae archaeon]|nr:hypothetical protein [Methanosarcinaceae archaeon]
MKNYYVYQDQTDPDIDSIYETLFFGNGRSKLNFQNLKEDYGVRKAYNLFFNVDLMKMLDPNENESSNKWNDLNLLFKERHDIVHKGKGTSFSQDKIKEILKSLIYMRDRLAEIVIPRYPYPDSCLTQTPASHEFRDSYPAKKLLT